MKKLILIFLVLLIGLLSCKKDNTTQLTKEQEFEVLAEMLSEIQELANSINCENSEDWSFAAYGSKAYGGPQGYIAYSTKLDVNDFFKRLEKYKEAEKNYNINWGISSDCAITPSPVGVYCNEGQPALEY